MRTWENAKDLPEAQRLVRLYQEALTGRRETFLAETDCRDLAPGLHIGIAGHPELDGDYLVLGIGHQGDQRAAFAYGDNVRGPTYRNVLHLIRAGVPWRPTIPAERRFHGTMVARIESPGGDYAHLDEQGRYRVRLGFDAGEAPAAGASHPVRAMQPYGGSDYGLHLPLHAGTEVLLSFVGGHLDRPVILGALPNPDTPTPVAAGNPSQNILRTAAGNELLLDDRKGKEKIELFTAGRKNILTLDADGQGHTVRLATAEGKMEVSAARTILLSSGDTHSLQSGADHLISVENAQRLTAAEGEIAQQAAADIRMRAGENVQIQTEEEDVALSCGENLIAEAGEEMSVEVRSGDLEIFVESGSLSLKAADAVSILGEGGGSIRIGQGAGEVEITSGGDITIDAPEVEIVGNTVAMQGSVNRQGGGGGGILGASLLGASLVSLPEFHNPMMGLYAAEPSRPMNKKERRQARQQLIASGRSNAAQMPDSNPRKQQTLQAADRFEKNIDAIELAHCSKDVYHQAGEAKDPFIDQGWLRGSENPELLELYGLKPEMLNPGDDSFYRAELYIPDPEIFGPDAKPVIAFKGTTFTSLADWSHNLRQGVGFGSDHYDRAIRATQRLSKATNGNLTVTGHSKGGGMGSAAGIVTGAETTAFNPAGVHNKTLKPYGKTRADGGHIRNYQVEGEILTGVQDKLPIPGAVGEIEKLPAVGDRGAVGKHSMDAVIDGIEQEKSNDEAVLKAAQGNG